MSHVSVVVPNSIELINVEATEFSPLISKCQIKVCYVGDEPNRNRSIITKEVATQMAPSLRGCPVVGYYNETTEDFEEHNKVIDISNGKFELKDTTRPYGFVDLNANVWFQKFMDDGIEHEYLMTEGYIWTGQYPEAQRIIDKGNNQSMELDEKSLNAQWTKDNNGNYKFFIINEAILSKLCILGEDVEPCFEGAQITKVQFAFDDDFKESLFSLVTQMKKILNEGGTPVFNTFAVEIGDSLWESLHDYLRTHYPDPMDNWCSKYRVEGIYEEGESKFAILVDKMDKKFYRLNFSITEAEGFKAERELIEVSKEFVPAEQPQFALEDVENYETEYKKKKEEEKAAEPKEEKSEEEKSEEQPKEEKAEEKSADKESEDEPEDKGEESEKPADKSEEEEEKKAKKKKYNLEEVEEYTELMGQFEELQTQFSALSQKATELENTVAALNETINSLETEKNELSQFKLNIEHKEKEDMIYKTFYMLDDEYKKDVIENIDTYSLDDIEAKLSVICVRNKVGFSTESEEPKASNTFNLDSINDEDQAVPAWVKAVSKTAKSMKI